MEDTKMKKLLEILQYRFPIDVDPWMKVAEELEMSEEELLGIICELKDEGVIRRIGAILNKGKLGYRSLLIALRVRGDYDEVVEFINSHIGVTHNYLREDQWNIWFTFNYADEGDLQTLVDRLREFPQVEDLMLLPSEEMIKVDARF